MSAHKDTFYRFLDNPDVNWRKALWRISLQLWNKIRVRTDHKTDDVCLILDDTDHEKTSKLLDERKEAYDTSKIELAKEMIRRAISHKLKFRYVLADSWFTNKEIVKFIHGLHVTCHWLGMIKVGEKSRTKYKVGEREFTAPQLVINESDKMAHICKFYNLSSAS